MPLYEYQCTKCNKVTEAIQKFSDAPLKVCPEVGCKGELKKLLSSTSFALKGSGWYTTDYKRKSSSAESSTAAAPPTTPAATPAATPATPTAAPKKPSSSE